MKTLKQTFKTLSTEELHVKVEELRRDLFSTRLHAMKYTLKDVTRLKKLRRAIACGLTLIHSREIAQAK